MITTLTQKKQKSRMALNSKSSLENYFKIGFLTLCMLGTIETFAQSSQNVKTNGNVLSEGEYIGTNNNEDLVIKTNGANNTIFKKNGEVKISSLQGIGNRVLYATDNGILKAYPLGQSGQVLSADGVWVTMPGSYWQLNANGNKLYTTINKIGINTSSPNFTLDVNGDGHFSGNLVLNGELIINEKITSPKQLFAKAMEVDSIKMDASKAIYGETNIKGDVKLKYTLDVLGNSTFHGDQSVDGISTSANINTGTVTSTNVNTGIVMATTKLVTNRITHSDSSLHIGDSSLVIDNFLVSNGAPANYDRIRSSFNALAFGTSSFSNGQYATSMGHSARAIASNATAIGSFLTASGIQSTAIGSGSTNGTSHNAMGQASITIGNNVQTGSSGTNAIVLGRNLTNNIPNSLMIGNSPTLNSTIPTLFVGPAPSGILGGNVGIGTSSPSTALHVIGFATISSLGGNGTKTVIVDNNGKLAVGGNNTVDWMVGGNSITEPTNYANEYLGTSGNSDLVFATNGTPRMIIGKTNGNIGFGTTTAPAADFQFQKNNANCEVKLNTTIATKAPILSFDNSVHSANIYLGNLGMPSGPTPFVMDWSGSHFLSYSNGNMLIGDPDYLVGDPLAGGDIYTKLTISARTSANVNPWNVVPLRIVNPDLTIANKVVYEVLNDGTVTSAKLAGSGTRSVVVNNNGQLMAGAPSSTTALNWNLGGNNITVPTNYATEYLGTSSNSDLVLATGGLPRMVIKDNGKIGINTGSFVDRNFQVQSLPNQKAEMLMHADANHLSSIYWTSNQDLGSSYGFGIASTPTEDNVAGIFWNLYSTTPSNPPRIMSFKMTPWGPQVRIGDEKPNLSGLYADARLSVDGKILAKEVRVTTSNTIWADYVFDKDYKLMTLEEVEKFYTIEKHLPNVPSACEVEEKGIDMAEMNSTLLRKIEENTLYLVELKKEIDLLKKENVELKKQQTK